MDNILYNKNVLITGATGGVGYELCSQFSNQGANLFVTGKHRIKLSTLSAEFNCKYKESDFNDDLSDLILSIREEIGSIDILVNCAGVFISDKIENLTLDNFDEIFNVNVKAPFLLIKEFSNDMKSKQWGRIINIGSNSAYNGAAENTLYCSTKHALLGLSKSIHQELKEYNIRTYCFSPGGMQTPMGKKINKDEFDKFISPKEFVNYIIHSIKYNSNMVSDEIKLNRMGV